MRIKDKLYLETNEEVAAYLRLSVSEFLTMKNRGEFGVRPRAIDPTMVFWTQDIDAWLRGGRPVENVFHER